MLYDNETVLSRLKTDHHFKYTNDFYEETSQDSAIHHLPPNIICFHCLFVQKQNENQNLSTAANISTWL